MESAQWVLPRSPALPRLNALCRSSTARLRPKYPRRDSGFKFEFSTFDITILFSEGTRWCVVYDAGHHFRPVRESARHSGQARHGLDKPRSLKVGANANFVSAEHTHSPY